MDAMLIPIWFPSDYEHYIIITNYNCMNTRCKSNETMMRTNILNKWTLHAVGWNTRCKYHEIMIGKTIHYRWKLYASGMNTRWKYHEIRMRKTIRYKWKLYASDKNTRCKYNDTLMTRTFATNENYMLQRRIHDANTMTHWWQEYSLQMKITWLWLEYTMQI